jgi:methylmalonic aciduria homocystinuria type C protein
LPGASCGGKLPDVTGRIRYHELGYGRTDADELGLPDFGRARTRGLIAWATADWWTDFITDWRRDPALRAEADPVERHSEREIAAAMASRAERVAIWFAHDEPPPPLQRIADRFGLAPLAASYLNVHPVYGPWIALRAFIAIDADGPPTEPAPPAACDCEAGCLPAFRRAMAASEGADGDPVAPRWRDWLAVRDACPVGREHRYSEQQIRYHYTKDRSVLG